MRCTASRKERKTMGALFFFPFFLFALAMIDLLPRIAWAINTLAKYTLYRAFKLGNMPMRKYFARSLKKFNDKWGTF